MDLCICLFCPAGYGIEAVYVASPAGMRHSSPSTFSPKEENFAPPVLPGDKHPKP